MSPTSGIRIFCVDLSFADCFIQFFYHAVEVSFSGKAAFLEGIGMPLSVWLIVRADVIYMKALFTEMLSALHQETGKVIEFIILQIDAILVSRNS